jgi:hypothetical protein
VAYVVTFATCYIFDVPQQPCYNALTGASLHHGYVQPHLSPPPRPHRDPRGRH